MSSVEEKKAEEIYDYILHKIITPTIGNKTTYKSQLDKYCKLIFGSKFKGVYASDEIPKLTNSQPYAILNLDTSYGFGTHWIAVAKNNKNILVYDSFGRKSKEIIPSIINSGNGLIIDTDYDPEQKESELNCGARCVSFLVLYDMWGFRLAKLI